MLKAITIGQADKWDEIVRSFNDNDVNYLSGYVKAFQMHGNGEPILFYYDDGSTRAINVVMKRDIAHERIFKNKLPIDTYFDLSTPYGYGGFIVEGNDYKTVNEAYDDFCKNKGFVSEFVRFHLLNDYRKYYNGLCETHTRNVIRSLELPLDDMFMDFEHKVRKSIKKATKTGLEIEIDSKGSRLDDFLKMYYGTMDRSNAKENFYFKEDFFQIINEMTNQYVYFHVLYEGQVISTELVIYGTENCYSFLGGTNREFFHLNANSLLKFEIIKWAKEKGLKRFILGGGYGADDGIYKYKKSFAPNGVYDFYVGKKIFDREKYNELVKIRSKEEEFNPGTSFFPLYRG
ncbi:GNAT family N-acetyltransferase [Ammoniphilus resinae]|uniref:Lipid II:glycine glycyltransferase n=1 Tax=Ammoniphilus resinae TaxID=861532 RepID=A0ABS4GXI1_9BACL|nr:hypothetical protein [Ammoniphilus resinae]